MTEISGTLKKLESLSGKKEIIRDAKGRIIKPIPQETNKNGTAGAPSKYELRYCQMLVDFFSVPLTRKEEIKHYSKDGKYLWSAWKDVSNEFPTYMMFAMSIGVDFDTLQEWKKVHPEFSVAYKKAKKLQEANWMRGTMKGQWNAQFAMFIGKNIYGYKDKSETDLSTKGKEIKGNINIVTYDQIKK